MRGLGSVWALLLAGPLLFLAAIVAVSVMLGARGVPPDQIGAAVPGYAPHILVFVLAALGGLVLWRLPLRTLWALPKADRAWRDLGWGIAVGAALAALYFGLLAGWMEALQRGLGDYVPPGEVLATVSGQIALFFLANVLLAPFVEETIYRGFALQRLTPRLGRAGAVVISCVAFGLLHWTGGLWYMVLTGVVAGGAFAALALVRGGLLAPFAAHLTLNLLEFLVVAQG